jgi:GNAT superfamily N-acetyltransferase
MRPSPEDLLRAYDDQLRAKPPDVLIEGEAVENDGPLLRLTGGPAGSFILYRDLGGLEGPELDALIARQVAALAPRGERFEWKYHGHDLPSDLPKRLRAAGFIPEDRETVEIALVTDIAAEPRLPEGVALRVVTERRDLERIGGLEAAVWGGGQWVADMLEAELRGDPDGLTVLVAEAGALVVCAAWIRFPRDTEFATLWGGATLHEWRRRGIYRATVAYRANLAVARRVRYLETDASDDSRPILERLGFVPVTTTTPYVWHAPER